MDFNDFEWHDSAIRNIRIDRTRPGKQDTIEFDRENEMVQEFYKLRKGLFDHVPLNYYEIETNSTGSKIQIVAKNFSYEIL